MVGRRLGNWKRNGRMMGERKFYSSSLHFNTEAGYNEYKSAYKKKFGKNK